jgi:phosphoadenosine phosphosulfate reductase
MGDAVERARRELRRIAEDFAPAVLASSLGPEDMVLTDLIDRHELPIGVFTLDTGRLHQETHDLLQIARRRYRVAIDVYVPNSTDIEVYVAAHGTNGFYDAVPLRLECCRLRKVEPLKRAIAGQRAWVTGQRRGQSLTRTALPLEEWDAENGLHKFNPLAEWSGDEVWAYIRAHRVPHNALHARGFPSIGCAPCTRAVSAGEDIRAGRWWWESANGRECGLHPRRGRDE